MLSCCPSYINTALCDTLYLTSSFYLSTFFKILKYISVSSLFCNCTNSSRLESLSFAKYNLCIGMCLTLILIREIKINIRLFISLKTKESFKWYIKTKLIKLMSALRTLTYPAYHSLHHPQTSLHHLNKSQRNSTLDTDNADSAD